MKEQTYRVLARRLMWPERVVGAPFLQTYLP